MNVLVVDDDAETRALITRALGRDGHAAIGVATCHEAEQALAGSSVGVIILDVMLDDESGLAFCRSLRAVGDHTPVLFLSARGTTGARIDGFEVGGDDYLRKPFSVRELLMRVRALGRRHPGSRAMTLRIGSVYFDFAARRAEADGREIAVTAREWDLLRVLADAEGRVVAFDDLLERLWGESTENARASLEVIVSRLRRKLAREAGVSALRTVRGSGYALDVRA